MFMRLLSPSAFTGFIITVKTDNAGTSGSNQFTIPIGVTGTFNYNISTSDGHNITGVSTSYTLTFSGTGTYDVYISGDFSWIYFAGGGDRLKLIDIKQWGDIVWGDFYQSFRGCSNLTTLTATDAPNLASVTRTWYMFLLCTSFNTNINHWNVSNITNMRGMFESCSLFNSPLNSWNVSNVTDFAAIFRRCYAFNQPLNSWNISSGLLMFRLLESCTVFNQDISSWDINQSTDLSNLLNLTLNFSTTNYDALLIAWEAQAPIYYGTISFGNAKYTLGGAADTARASLISTYGWVITDGGGI